MQSAVTEAGGWTAWSAAERESFFAAIARHRRAAWRVTLASLIGNLAVAIIVAILMCPLFYGSLALLLDLINLVIPVPNIVPPLGRFLGRALNAPHTLGVLGWVRFAAVAALPGLVWMAFVMSALRRVLRICMTFEAGELAARAPDMTALAEQRFANVVAEMAIAASIPAPRVFVADSGIVDAVAFGTDEQHASIVVSQGLLSRLNRAQMEGVAANLIASIADGDMAIGVRAALSVTLFALIARLGTLVTQQHARRNIAQIVRVTLLPTADSARKFLGELSSPLSDEGAPAVATPTDPRGLRARWEKIRPFLWLPLAGPLVITGFFGAIVNLFVLAPLLSLAWRQRKYMADATAVRLTRDPDTLASALEQMNGSRGAALAPWAAHMSIIDHGGRGDGPFGGGAVPMFPSIDRRLRALGSLGAHLQRAPRKIPLKLILIVSPLLIIVGGLVALMLPLLVWLSLALTMLFSGLPFAIIHALLRWLGHH